jgi:branched-chain amino acid transport system permease protein
MGHLTFRRNPASLFGHATPWLIAILFYFLFQDRLGQGTEILIWVLFTISLDLALGYAGIVTLGHAAFFGIGAYTAGILSIRLTGDPLLGMLAATAIAGVAGFITGVLILHTTGVTLLMLTLAIAAMIENWANRARDITGGDDGLQGMQVDPLFGIFEFNFFGYTAFWYALAVLFVWFLIAYRVVHSPFGRSIDGIRQSAKRMRAIGTPVWWRLVAIYALSAAMAGSAGALSAYKTEFVGLTVLQLLTSGIVAVMLILGGQRTIYGAFLGAAVYILVRDYASEIWPFLSEAIIGIMLILVVLFLEDGLMSVPRLLRRGGAGRPNR